MKQLLAMALFFGGITRQQIDQKLVAVLEAVPEKNYGSFAGRCGIPARKLRILNPS
jgi:hypothetical protein